MLRYRAASRTVVRTHGAVAVARQLTTPDHERQIAVGHRLQGFTLGALPNDDEAIRTA